MVCDQGVKNIPDILFYDEIIESHSYLRYIGFIIMKLISCFIASQRSSIVLKSDKYVDKWGTVNSLLC